MKIKTMSLFVLSFFITGCAGTLPSRPVTMIGNDKDHYIGKLVYQDGLVSGILSIDVGPNGEAFTGNYVVVNRTAYSSTQG